MSITIFAASCYFFSSEPKILCIIEKADGLLFSVLEILLPDWISR